MGSPAAQCFGACLIDKTPAPSDFGQMVALQQGMSFGPPNFYYHTRYRPPARPRPVRFVYVYEAMRERSGLPCRSCSCHRQGHDEVTWRTRIAHYLPLLPLQEPPNSILCVQPADRLPAVCACVCRLAGRCASLMSTPPCHSTTGQAYRRPSCQIVAVSSPYRASQACSDDVYESRVRVARLSNRSRCQTDLKSNLLVE